MQPISILVCKEDLEAADEIAKVMFPEEPGTVTARNVLGTAARLGIEQLKLMYGLKESTVRFEPRRNSEEWK